MIGFDKSGCAFQSNSKWTSSGEIIKATIVSLYGEVAVKGGRWKVVFFR